MSAARLPPWSYLLLALVPFPLTLLPLPEGFPQPLRLLLAAAIVAWALVMTLMHSRGLDEPAKAAHKTSWYFGGTVGLGSALLACALPFFSSGAADLVHALSEWGKAGDPVTRTFFYGAAFAGVMQVIAFGLAWLLWWAPKR